MTLRFDANLKWLFTEYEFEARFDAASAAGFRGVEYASPYPYEAAQLKRLLDDAGLEQVLINTPMGEPGTLTRQGLACIPEVVDEYRDGVLRGLEYATALGASFLHVVGGIIPDDVSRDLAFATYITNIAWAAEQAKTTGVRLLLETQNKRNAPGFILESQAQAAAVVEAIGSSRVGLLLDFYHAQIDEGDLISTYERFKDLILHIQVADPPARHEPGTGEINWGPLFSAVAASGYAGWIGCEYEPANGTAEGLGWMKEYAR
ncbi:hydroxypyruvate isomerase [Microbacterium sp. BE35]|uniref:hydroxypyruvate isomerase family protein n=1 Tax=Microbacterium sp. BE35 TaxID=2817773 RepID=UPI002859C795|nr:TIM barrel protein [Microbacterium sp. BE35]MDR7188240.1 hydroxypyruvate isomerase [Microbacterium sp. BE35]